MKKTIGFVVIAVMIIALGGCSGGPSKQELKDLVLTAATMRNPTGWEFGKFDITNDYKKTIQNETAYVYELQFTLKRTDGSSIDGNMKETPVNKYKITLTKEGKEWRYLVGWGVTGPMQD